jgi:hypothetical protein
LLSASSEKQTAQHREKLRKNSLGNYKSAALSASYAAVYLGKMARSRGHFDSLHTSIASSSKKINAHASRRIDDPESDKTAKSDSKAGAPPLAASPAAGRYGQPMRLDVLVPKK